MPGLSHPKFELDLGSLWEPGKPTGIFWKFGNKSLRIK